MPRVLLLPKGMSTARNVGFDQWLADAQPRGLISFHLPKLINSSEDVTLVLIAAGILLVTATRVFVMDRSRETSSRAFARCADARVVREFGRWLASHRQPPLPFALPGFPELSGVEEADQHGSGRYLHTNSTIATEARFHILDSGIFLFYSSEWPRFKL
jgi:hypothetical protein